MAETTTETTPDAIGYGFAEVVALIAMQQGDAATASAEALRVDEYLEQQNVLFAGASSLVARGLATVDDDGALSVSGPTAAVASALTRAHRRMEITLLTPEQTDSVIGVESDDFELLFQPRTYLTWWAMAQRPDISAAEANLFIVEEHIKANPVGGAMIRRREDETGETLYIKREGASWTIGLSTATQEDVTERAGLDDAALLAEIRRIRQEG